MLETGKANRRKEGIKKNEIGNGDWVVIWYYPRLVAKAATKAPSEKDRPTHLSRRDMTDDYTSFTDSDTLKEALQRIEDELMYFIERRNNNAPMGERV